MPLLPRRTSLAEPVRRVVGSVRRGSKGLREWLLRRPSRSILACGVFGFALAALITVALEFPPPNVHDEFSYLLAGDTFASGRLSYPTHAMWRHFETFHVLQVPSYASKYPPAQGLFIALGQRLTGLPVAGIWISCGLFIAALNWMMLAWTRPRWALYGALGAALWLCGRHASGGYWTWSFWGGSVAAMGGALVLGGVRRLAREPTVAASLATGVGVAVVANSRPFEGLFFVTVPAGVVVWVLFRQIRLKRWRPALVAVAPMMLVLAAAGVLMGVYNYRITGSTTLPPYLVYEKQYAASPALLGQAVPTRPQYRIGIMEEFYLRGSGRARQPENWRDHIRSLRDRTEELADFYVPRFIVPLLFMLPWAASGGWIAIAVGCIAVIAVAPLLTLFGLKPHYVAPVAAAWCVLLTLGARFAAQLRWRRTRVGRGLVGLILLCLAASTFMEFGAGTIRRLGRKTSWSWQRKAIEQRLARAGKHLVVVKYGPEHDSDREWVFNRADIDAAAVVWARSLGESQDADLRRYFQDRTAWQLAVDDDAGPFTLTPLAMDSARQPRRP